MRKQISRDEDVIRIADVKSLVKLKKRYDEEQLRFLIEKGAFPERMIKNSVAEHLRSWSNSLTANNTENEKG